MQGGVPCSEAQDLLPNPDEAVVVVAAGPKPNAVDAVVLGPNEPNENPDVSSKKKINKINSAMRVGCRYSYNGFHML